jgi:hypothetical protein
MIKPIACALLAAALAGCAADQRQTTPDQAADMCRTFRGYLSTQPRENVMESCTRQLGEPYCRQCLQ